MTILKLSEIEDLFGQLIKNAIALSDASTALLKSEQKQVSLGLSELALEELGKSFTCLAFYSVESSPEKWKMFWVDWKAHEVKAQRAFLYEFFSTQRYELVQPPDYYPSKRKIIPIEKEVSFYIDFDIRSRKVIIPSENIDTQEIVYRASSVLGPLATAATIHDLFHGKEREYKNAFSDYARYVMENKIYQQNGVELLNKMKNGIKEYDLAIDEIIEMFTSRMIPENI